MSLKKRSSLFCSLLLLVALRSQAQLASGAHVVAVETPQNVKVKPGAGVEVPLRLIIRGGYHINSNAPAEDYLIPTALTWESSALTPKGVTFPKAESVKYEFAEKPLLVFSSLVTVVARFSVAADAARGPLTLSGKLRYQACTDKMCLAPRTLAVSVPVTVE